MQTATSAGFATTLRRVRRLAVLFVGLVLAGCAATEAEWDSAAYREAVRERYRVYSFGDAMLILP